MRASSARTRVRDEVEPVRAALGAGPLVLYRRSWGDLLAIEVVLASPQSVRMLVISNTTAGMPSHARHLCLYDDHQAYFEALVAFVVDAGAVSE